MTLLQRNAKRNSSSSLPLPYPPTTDVDGAGVPILTTAEVINPATPPINILTDDSSNYEDKYDYSSDTEEELDTYTKLYEKEDGTCLLLTQFSTYHHRGFGINDILTERYRYFKREGTESSRQGKQ